MTPEISPDAEALARAAADLIASVIEGKTGQVALCLSGGSTPKRAYELLADRTLPWDRVHLFWGDERFVPPEDDRSNQRMTRRTLIDKIGIPPGNVHAVPTQNESADQAAAEYAAQLSAFYGSDTLRPDRPLFDLVLLGLGTNGHTASLFPGTPALTETRAWAVAVTPEGEPTRITLTYPALESAGQVAFLVSGAEKKPMLDRLLAGDESIPAGRVHPVGRLRVLADAAAQGQMAG